MHLIRHGNRHFHRLLPMLAPLAVARALFYDRVTFLLPFQTEQGYDWPWIVLISIILKENDVLKWCIKTDHPQKLNFILIFCKRVWITNQWPCSTVLWWTMHRVTSFSFCNDTCLIIHTQRQVYFKRWTWKKYTGWKYYLGFVFHFLKCHRSWLLAVDYHLTGGLWGVFCPITFMCVHYRFYEVPPHQFPLINKM